MRIEVLTILSLKVFKMVIPSRDAKVEARPFHTLSLRMCGESVINAAQHFYKIKPGTVVFIPAGLSYHEIMPAETSRIAVHFTTAESIGTGIEVISRFQEKIIEGLFCKLLQHWSVFPRENSLRCMAAFYNLMDILYPFESHDHKNSSLSFLKDTESLMYMNYRDSNFKIQNLYNSLFCDATYFRRIFKKTYGCTPGDFLKQLRINHAKTLLKTDIHTIAEVAELSGFSSSSYFSYAFKKYTGLSPTDFIRTDA